ncbi:tRNA/tmRNA/rRNA uracil-C5-methylase (TrmA/RlmC/RlmD family) [Brevibacterium sanguinis]|uniref:tRNA/tmRNA/rRNA uracil-C5-methylase (TrmA/RlmC/RlmD family) n=2 Tax=Brevibacterium TaxID=1696 RepID=A0A366IGM5_9MICO|nr:MULTISPECIES: TRAM domain-containing protein [Brevibacterium]RBP63997.1 tRNA/tmRNA/rRNA uracil-C5-methylase (TrmA/RlmC/RlmD family) [Brevibacterium sanguinis]RBP70728.1 tRNA/tmRNA/rRNA uracil-C5-methylase (TrmA/RlmC/RlmD family) [Brevibacterium celere]
MSETPTTDSAPAELELLIDGPAAGGTCVARHRGQVVFVAGAVPGERVRARTVGGKAATFLRAEVVEVLEPSGHRVPDRRRGYAIAGGPRLFGGMEFAHVELAHSRELKAQVLADQLARIAHLDLAPTVEAAPGETTGLDWRTRVQLAVDAAGRPGMLAARSHEVVPVASAPLACPEIAEVALADLRLPGAERLEFAWADDRGAVIVRGAPGSGPLSELSLALGPQWSILAEEPAGSGRGSNGADGGRPGVGRSGRRSRGRTSARSASRRGGAAGHRQLRVVRGSHSLTQTVLGRRFEVAADGFWQVHRQAPSLLSSVVTAAVPADTTTITDLYCGVGLLGIGAAAEVGARLHGIEGARAAIAAARINADGLDAHFAVGRVDAADLPESDVVILDPPRAGAGPAVTSSLLDSGASTLVYVSCDAATLARDLKALRAGGFEIESLRGFDLFPLTAHLETVTVLRR